MYSTEILYMNPKAVENYHKWGGEALVGKCLMNCHNPKSKEMIEKVIAWFQEDRGHNQIHTFYNEKQAKDVYMVALRDEDGILINLSCYLVCWLLPRTRFHNVYSPPCVQAFRQAND